jgi:hypothetical protein
MFDPECALLASAPADPTPQADQAAGKQDEGRRFRSNRFGAIAPGRVDADVVEAIEALFL